MKYIFSLLIASILFIDASAQSTFGKIFRSKAPFPIYNGSHATFLQTIDSALLLIYNVNDTTPGTNLYLQKLTNDGDVIWEKYIALPDYMETLQDAVQLPDSTIDILCTYDIPSLIYDEEVYHVRIDLNGNLITTDFQTSTGICCWDISDGRLNLSNNGKLLSTHLSFGISTSFGIVMVDDTNYNYIYGGNDGTALYHSDIFQDLNNNYITFGYEPTTQQKRASIVKRNQLFTFQWQKFFRHSATAPNRLTYGDDALQVDSNYILLMHFEDTDTLNNIYILKTNMNGDSVTSVRITNESIPFGMYSLGNAGFLLGASGVTAGNYSYLELMRLDTSFQIIARQKYRYKNFNERMYSFKPADDGTYLVAASADSNYNRNIHILKVKTDLCIDPSPSFTANYNTGLGAGVAGLEFHNTSDYGVWDTLNTTATIYFGDGDSADFYVDSLTHIYATQGTYTVTVIITTPCGTKSISQPVTVPCTGQPSAFTYSSNLLSLNVAYNYSASFYNWNFGDLGTANTQTANHLYALPGTYYVCLNTTNSCGNIEICDSVTVVCTPPVIPFSNVAKACTGTTISINAGNNGSTYLWSDGQTTQVANFTAAGIYTVTVTNNCGESSTKSVDVQFSALPLIDIGIDTIMCINDQATLTNLITGNNYGLQWFNNYVLQSTGSAYYFSSSNTGLFYITLIADNNGCIDSVHRYISVNPGLFCDTGSYCIPTYTTGTAQGDYIKRVGIGTINNITGGTGQPGYVDYTNITTTLNAGASVTLTLEFNEINPMYYKIWIDYNQDGVFSNTEALSSGAVNSGVSTTFTSLSSNAYGGPTRMRVRCANSTNSNIDPCANYTFGQTEDYTIIILNGNGAPIVNFDADTTHIYINDVVNFTDLSLNTPAAWEWTFTGASTTTSTLKNPAGIVYPSPGCFPVTLQAYNANGFNVKTDTCYIFVDLALSVQEHSNENFSVQPNPFNNQFKLNYKIADNASATVYDVTGRNIFSINLDKNSGSTEIDLSQFNNGVYYLVVKNSESVLCNMKLIKIE